MDERYRIIVEQTKSVVFDWGPEQQLHYAPYLGSLLDCRNNPGNVPDMLRSLTVHPRDMADFKAFHASLYREDQVETTVRLRRRDGAFIWCRIAATLKRDAQGKLLRIVGTISDMDDNVRALRHLALSGGARSGYGIQQFRQVQDGRGGIAGHSRRPQIFALVLRYPQLQVHQ